jgi:uncharacterized RDD family membrane protein YckC
MTGPSVAPDRDLRLQGHYAGAVTRLGAFAIDVSAATTLFALGASVVEYIVGALVGRTVNLSDAQVLSMVALGLWWVVYCVYPLAVAGRTLGMAILGLQVVLADGRDLDGRHALLRVLIFPLSLLLVVLSVPLVLLRRDRCALHDLIGGAAVVYAWDARAARLRFLAGRRGT